MGYVVNLGHFGTAQESPLSGLSDALATGLKIREQKRSNMAQEDIQRSEVKQKADNSATYEQAVNQEKANLDFKKAQANRSNAYKTLVDWSTFLNSKSPQEQAMLRSSEHGQAIENDIIKTYLPEYYDKEKKQAMILSNKQIIGDNVNAMVAQAKQSVASGKGTQEDINLIKLTSKDPALLTNALDYAQKQIDSNKEQGDPDKHNKLISYVKDFFSRHFSQKAQSTNSLTPSLSTPVASAPQDQSQGNLNTNSLSDPMGIYK